MAASMERRAFLTGGAAAAAAGLAQGQQKKIQSSLMLWTIKGTIEQKLEIAAGAGMDSVEFVGEHSNWTDSEIEQIKRLTRSMKLGMDALSAMPNWSRIPVSMVDAAQRENMLAEVQKNIVFAKKLEIPALLLMSGNAIPGRTFESQWASLVEGSKRAGELAAKAGVDLIVEPLNNKVNHKGFFLSTCVDGLKLLKEVDNPRVRLLFDIYHEQVQLGNVTRTILEAVPYVSVFHVADNPGRNDPGTGEMNYDNIYRAIRKTGYAGYITMEYLPLGDAAASLTKAVKDMRSALA